MGPLGKEMRGGALGPRIRRAPSFEHTRGIRSNYEERTGWKLMFLEWSGVLGTVDLRSPAHQLPVGMHLLSNDRNPIIEDLQYKVSNSSCPV